MTEKTSKTTKKPLKTPKLRLHKSSDRAVATFNGKDVYFGTYGTSEAVQKYHRFAAEWEHNGQALPNIKGDEVQIVELAAAFLEYAENHYRRPDGTPTSRIYTVERSLAPLLELYGDLAVAEFGPKAFAVCRDQWIKAGLTRQTCNDYANMLRLVFKWGVSEEMVPAPIYDALKAVGGLRAGRTKAKENRTRKPVPQAHINALKPHVSGAVWGLIQLQLHSGARSGELVGLRAVDIDTTGKIWIAKPNQHKTSWRGKSRELLFGPKAQKVLKQFLTARPVDAPLFNPLEGVRELAKRNRLGPGRRPYQKRTPNQTNRQVGDQYTSASYGRAVRRACEDAGIDPPWSPHQLRHTAATRLRKEFGIEMARIILGHSSAITTETYAEADRLKAFSAVGKLG